MAIIHIKTAAVWFIEIGANAIPKPISRPKREIPNTRPVYQRKQ